MPDDRVLRHHPLLNLGPGAVGGWVRVNYIYNYDYNILLTDFGEYFLVDISADSIATDSYHSV